MALPTFMQPTIRDPFAAGPHPRGATNPFVNAVAPPGGGRSFAVPNPTVTFPMDKQRLPHWCWAAVAAGVACVRGRSPNTQEGIAGKYALHTRFPWVKAALTPPPTRPPSARSDTIGYLNEVLDFLNLTRVVYQPFTPGVTAQSARTDLAAGVPVPIRICWRTTGGGHFVALIGIDNTRGSPDFVVYDPSETKEDLGHRVVVPEDRLANAYDGIGSWSHMYPVL